MKIPLSLLVREDSPLAGFFTSWFALGTYTPPANTTPDKRKTNQVGEFETVFKTIAMGFADNNLAWVQFKAKLQELDDSQVDNINRKTQRAIDYIAEHLQNTIKSVLIELIQESQLYALRAAALENGLNPGDIKNEGRLVDLFPKAGEREIKSRLQTRRPGLISDPDRETQLRRFAELTNKRKDVAECLVDIAKHNPTADWRALLDTDINFQYHCGEYEQYHRDPAILKRAAGILCDHQNDAKLLNWNKTKWNRATSAE